jgi:hypothetical protein
MERKYCVRHTETMSVQDSRQMHYDIITLIRAFRRHLTAEAEAIYGRSDTAGDYRGRD